jgi:hypothetical protein
VKRLEIEEPSLEMVKNWEKSFLQGLKDDSEWIGEPDDYSVRLYILDGTSQVKFENGERIQDALSSLNLYSFFADAGTDQISDQNRIFDQKQNIVNKSFNGSRLPHSKEAYLDSFSDIVPEISFTERFIEPVEMEGVVQNLEAANKIEQFLSNSEDYTVSYVKLNAGEVAESAVEAYRNLQSNCSVEIGFVYEGDRIAESDLYEAGEVPGQVYVDGDVTDVEIYLEDVDIETPDVEQIFSSY